MPESTGKVVATLCALTVVVTTVWVALSLSDGAELSDRSTVGQFVLAAVALYVTLWVSRQAFLQRPEVATSRAPRGIFDLQSRAGCEQAQRFLRTHDGMVVYLQLTCPDHVMTAFSQPDTSYSFCVRKGNWSSDSPHALHFWTRVDDGSGFNFSNPDRAAKVMQIVIPERPIGSTMAMSSNNGNLSRGAGGLTVRGYFYVTVGGSGSAGPPGIAVAVLGPVVPPVG